MPIKARQTWDEFCAELEAEKERELKAMASWRVQMREQQPRPHAKRNVLLGILAGICIWVAGFLAVILWRAF